MMQETVDDRELVSALADGQLRDDEFARAMALLHRSAEHRLTWHAYHVLGDVMRNAEGMASGRDGAFLQRLKLSLAQENTVVSGVSSPELLLVHPFPQGDNAPRVLALEAANEPRFRWKVLAGVASLALVSVLVWQAFGLGAGGAAQLARTSTPTLQSAQSSAQDVASTTPFDERAVLMIRDPRLDALLAAHQQVGGVSALQMPSGFVRNATFTGAGR